MFRSQAGAGSAVDDPPGGGVDDPGGGNTDDLGANGDLAISTATSSKTSASFVSSYLTTRISLLSLSDKSTVDVVGNLGVDCALRYWVFLFLVMLFVRHPAARRVREKGALAFGVWCDVE